MNAPLASMARERPLTVMRNADDVAIATYLAKTKAATVFHDPRWTGATHDATGHTVYRLTVAGSDGKITGYLPLVHVRSRLFGSALVSSAFAVSGGILADTTEAASVLEQAARDLARELDVGNVELRGGVNPERGWSTDSETYAGFIGDLALGLLFASTVNEANKEYNCYQNDEDSHDRIKCSATHCPISNQAQKGIF